MLRNATGKAYVQQLPVPPEAEAKTSDHVRLLVLQQGWRIRRPMRKGALLLVGNFVDRTKCLRLHDSHTVFDVAALQQQGVLRQVDNVHGHHFAQAFLASPRHLAAGQAGGVAVLKEHQRVVSARRRRQPVDPHEVAMRTARERRRGGRVVARAILA